MSNILEIKNLFLKILICTNQFDIDNSQKPVLYRVFYLSIKDGFVRKCVVQDRLAVGRIELFGTGSEPANSYWLNRTEPVLNIL